MLLILIYVLNYMYGKMRNQNTAHKWFAENLPLLQRHFALAGDDGVSSEPEGGQLLKDTDCSYSVWCSGRAGVQGMLTQIKLIKRQDLLGVIMQTFKPKADRVIHKLDLDKNEMDSIVIIFGQKKSVTKMVKELADLVGEIVVVFNEFVFRIFILLKNGIPKNLVCHLTLLYMR